MSRPRIHSILLAKNEADVIEYCLREASKWSDFIYVYDGDSTDDTWEIVNSLKSKQIIPFKQDGKVFREGLRAEVFNAYRSNAREGDWWCQLNTDEFYIDDPVQFLAEVKLNRHVVWGLFVQYYITHGDVAQLDFSGSCEQVLPQLRYHNACYAERRFFRHRNRLSWNENDAWPKHLGIAEERLIRFKHYPYRSPKQIQMRLDIRRDNRKRGFEGWETAKQETWQEKIVEPDQFGYEEPKGAFVVDPAVLTRHWDGLHRRAVQSFMRALRVWP